MDKYILAISIYHEQKTRFLQGFADFSCIADDLLILHSNLAF